MGARLSTRDIRSLLGFLRETYASRDSEEFATHTTRALRRVLPCDRASYNEWFGEPGKFRSFIDPDGRNLDGQLGEAMARHGHENPVLSYYRRTRREEVRVFSDFVTRDQLHRLPLYNEYYRRVEVEHQMIVPLALKSPPDREIGFALSRRRTDFSSHDRRVLELLQPHLVQAYENSRVVSRLRAARSCLEEAVESNGQGVIVLDREGTIRFATRRGREILEEYFRDDRPRGDRLPEDLVAWMRLQAAELDGEAGIAAPRRPYVLAREGRRLSVRFLDGGENPCLLLEERADGVDLRALARLGLTRRQSEVLGWITRGKSNEEIAAILGMRPATVAKHLERVYQKLGVESRTAAAARAFDAAG